MGYEKISIRNIITLSFMSNTFNLHVGYFDLVEPYLYINMNSYLATASVCLKGTVH